MTTSYTNPIAIQYITGIQIFDYIEPCRSNLAGFYYKQKFKKRGYISMFELSILWISGRSTNYRFTSREEAEKSNYLLTIAYGQEIAHTGIYKRQGV